VTRAHGGFERLRVINDAQITWSQPSFAGMRDAGSRAIDHQINADVIASIPATPRSGTNHVHRIGRAIKKFSAPASDSPHGRPKRLILDQRLRRFQAPQDLIAPK
jgi:hypothetical protein